MLHVKSPRHDTLASVYMNLIRGLAAVAVLISHVSLFFFDNAFKTFWTHFFWASIDIGQQAVMVFFVLSGFLIGGTVLKTQSRSQFSWALYLVQRFTRLYVVLIPALLLTIGWDFLGMHWFGPQVYAARFPLDHMLLGNVYQSSGWQTLLFNGLFLQEIHATTYGSDAALWSLAFEFWYYILFPLGLLAATAAGWRQRLLYGICAAALCTVEPRSILLYFSVWLFGALIHLIPPLKISGRVKRQRYIVGACLLLLASVYVHPLIADWVVWNVPADFLVGASAALLLYLLASWYNCSPPSSTRYHRAANTMAGFSYTLYLTHYPVLVFIQAALVRHGFEGWSLTPMHGIYALMITSGVLLYSWLIAQVTEVHTTAVRKVVTGQLSRIRAVALRWARPLMDT